MNITYQAAHQLKELISRFKIETYGDYERIKEQISKLPFAEFQAAHGGDRLKAEELWITESTVGKDQIAWLTKEEFSGLVKGFTVGEIEFLEYWIVK